MQGRRIPDRTDFTLEGIQPGDYWKDPDRGWYCAVPDPKIPTYKPECFTLPAMAGLGKHDITEHEDGTITVSPSILLSTNWGPDWTYHEIWHGFLERGVWRSC